VSLSDRLARLLSGSSGGGSGLSVPPRMEQHRTCLENGRAMCMNDPGPRAEGSPGECPFQYPQVYNMTREQVERLADAVQRGEA
jgi:hypothetical protein